MNNPDPVDKLASGIVKVYEEPLVPVKKSLDQLITYQTILDEKLTKTQKNVVQIQDNAYIEAMMWNIENIRKSLENINKNLSIAHKRVQNLHIRSLHVQRVARSGIKPKSREALQ